MQFRILTRSLFALFILGLVAVGGTGAFFSSEATSAGNVFTAGELGVSVGNVAQTYNGAECDTSGVLPHSALCELWETNEFTGSQVFFNFSDVKPGDYGTNTIDVEVLGNDGWSCLFVHDIVDDGDLGALLEGVVWIDENQNGKLDGAESEFLRQRFSAPFEIPLHDAFSGNGVHPANTPRALSFAWCAGDLSFTVDGEVLCDGEESALADHNLAQGDTLSAIVTAYATQSRNNPSFECSLGALAPSGGGGGGGPSPM